jgi:hypothetical protein
MNGTKRECVKKRFLCTECLAPCEIIIHGHDEGECNIESKTCCPQRSLTKPRWKQIPLSKKIRYPYWENKFDK